MIAVNSKHRSMDECRRYLAYHEAGHWLVAKAAGFRVGEIVLTVNGNLVDPKKKIYHFDGTGSSHIDPEPSLASLEDVDDYLVKRMAVLIAGVAAQKVVHELDVQEIWADYATDDRGKLDELSFILRGIRFSGNISRDTEQSQRLELVREAGQKAKLLLENNMQVLFGISEFLIKRVDTSNKTYTFRPEELEEIFKRHHG